MTANIKQADDTLEQQIIRFITRLIRQFFVHILPYVIALDILLVMTGTTGFDLFTPFICLFYARYKVKLKKFIARSMLRSLV